MFIDYRFISLRLQFSESCICVFAVIASKLNLSQKSEWCLKLTLTSKELGYNMTSSNFTDLIWFSLSWQELAKKWFSHFEIWRLLLKENIHSTLRWFWNQGKETNLGKMNQPKDLFLWFWTVSILDPRILSWRIFN